MALYYRLGTSSTMYVFSMPPHLVGLLQHFHSCFFVKVLQIFFSGLVWSYRSKSAAASLARLERIKPLLSCCSVGIEKKIGLIFLQSRTFEMFAAKAKFNVFFKYFRVIGDTE